MQKAIALALMVHLGHTLSLEITIETYELFPKLFS